MAFVIENQSSKEVLFDFDPFENERSFTTIDEMMQALKSSYDDTRDLDDKVLLRYVSGNQVFTVHEFNKHSMEKTMQRLRKKVELYGLLQPDFPVIVNLTDEEKEEAKNQNVGNDICTWWW